MGCNNDQMTQVPRGVVGVRLDGVQNVLFRKLSVSELYEESDLGSTLCGEYWDGDDEGFGGHIGGGHYYQTAPYLMGYTGNMAHGLMSDWSSFSLQSTISIHHIRSETGLVRGIALYPSSTLTLFTLNQNAIANGMGNDGDDSTPQQQSVENTPSSKGKNSQSASSGTVSSADGKDTGNGLNPLDNLEPLPVTAEAEKKATSNPPRPKAKTAKLDALKKRKVPVLRQQVCLFVVSLWTCWFM